MHRLAGLILTAAATAFFVSTSYAQPAGPRWFKGNTHTHTLNSDGDSTPDMVVRWYRENGYHFVFITDHEYITDVAPLNQLFGRTDRFIVISGQEVTDRVGSTPYHINGLGLTRVVMPNGLADPVATLQKNIDQVRAAGGVPQLNHPNFGWALKADQIAQLKDLRLMEIWNGHPLVNNLGGGGSPSAEAIWDDVLTRGMRIYGIADDDSHSFKRPGDRSVPLPGQAWIYVRANELSGKAILEALDRGDFYASTGVELTDIKADKESYSVTIKTDRSSRYTVQFIGERGVVLQEAYANPAVYRFTRNERYVRAKILESNGKVAWTQPVFLR